MRKLRKFLALPLREKKWVFQIALRLWVMEIALHVLPFKKILSLISSSTKKRAGHLKGAKRLFELVHAADASLFKKSLCLRKALALFWMFGSEEEVLFHIGIKKDQEGFLAHAWIKHPGFPTVSAETEELYQTLLTFKNPS